MSTLCLFNKKTPLYAGLSSKQENFLATAKQLIRKNSVCCLKNQEIFCLNIEIGLIPLPLFYFVRSFFPPPLHKEHTF